MTENIDKKLRETGFFLDEMREQEKRAFGDKEPFDFKLSAFLNAGMSVRNVIERAQNLSQNPAIKGWKAKWEGGLKPDDWNLYDYMREDRRHEVHLDGSRRDVKNDEIKVGVGGVYSDDSGTLYSMGSNIPGSGMGGAFVRKPHYYFTVDGVERDVTEVCAEYLALLERMAAQFKADNP
jgi:hypothetical protein